MVIGPLVPDKKIFEGFLPYMVLYMTFVDLTQAFDTFSRGGLREIMAKCGCPPRFIKPMVLHMIASRPVFKMMESTL